MTLLLDTHALLWAVADPFSLSIRAREAVLDGTHKLLVSSASAWEVATKHRLGRLPEASALLVSFEEHILRLRAEELTISIRHAVMAGSFVAAHRDPFDRMLAAQAIVEGVPLVTCDPAFSQFPVERIW